MSPRVIALDVPRAEPAAAARAGGPVLAAHLRRPTLSRFDLLGVTWRAGSEVDGLVVKARTVTRGRWSPWVELHHDDDEGPSASEEAAVREGTEPLWVGDATGVEVSLLSADGSAPADVDVAAVDAGSSTYDSTADGAAPAGTEMETASAAPPGFPVMPRIIARRQWGADERLGSRCDAPRYGTSFKAVFVHHTAGSNNYTQAQSASIVRGIHAYHTVSRGWCDIGYNFLVDRYGNVFEGRRGGIRLPVRGAHSGDYNVDSTGISLMGNFDQAYPTRAMKSALVRLAAWRLGTAYHSGYGGAVLNGKWFKRISGHRDAMSTSCPGRYVYEFLPGLRRRVTNYLSGFDSRIRARWEAMGGAGGTLGHVYMGEQNAAGGRFTVFNRGDIYQGRAGVRVLLPGAIRTKYLLIKGVYSWVGYPSSPVWSPAPGLRTARFDRGQIYWSRPTGTWVLSGPILAKYRQVGGPTSALGMPTTGVFAMAYGQRARFQHGAISWYRASNTTVVTYR